MAGLVLLFAVLGLSCARRKSAGDQRVLVLPLENLTLDSRLDWVSRTAPAVLAYDLGGIEHLIAFSGDSQASAFGTGATLVVQGYLALGGGQLEIHASLENPETRKTVRQVVLAGARGEGVLPLLERLAKELNSGARPFSTQNLAALRAYGQALTTVDPQVRSELLTTAMGADPKFSNAYLAQAENLLTQGDRVGAAGVASRGAAQAASAIDRERLNYLAGVANMDVAGRERALRSLARLTPAEPQVPRTLAEIHTSQRRYREAIQDLESLVRLEPGDTAAYNQLGYLHGYLQDLDGARKAFARYQELAGPGDVNPIDSLGEVYFFNGDFGGAERLFVEAEQKSPAGTGGREVLKAAEARVMTGDVAGADSLFQRYVSVQRELTPAGVEIEQARWQFITGRRKQAMARLEALAAKGGDIAALAGTHLSLWHLQTGDRAGAARLAADANRAAVSAGTKNLSSICGYLAAATFEKSPYATISAISLILRGQVLPAIEPLEKAFRETGPDADAEVRTLLAYAYVETGKKAQAKGLTELYPIPLASNESLFTTLIFPRFLALRAAVLGDQGSKDLELFRKLSGDLPDLFGAGKR